jgi:glucokinase
LKSPPHNQNSLIAAVDLGGTKVAAACISGTGDISHHREVATPAEGGDAVVDQIAALIQGLPLASVSGVAVDVPGLAYPNGDVWAPNIPGWEKMPLRHRLHQRFHLPVLVESDRNAFVTGEAWCGAARGAKDVIFLIVGTGIGAGILSGGRLIRGHAELAGAVGWMAIRDQFEPEYASVGCAESLAAGPAIGIHATRRFGRELTAREVVQLARRGDEQARELLTLAGYHLGLVIANLVSTLNPEVIVVGGGVASGGELLLKPAREAMLEWAQPLASKQVRIVRSRLGANAGLLGVARLAFDAISDEQ